MYHKIFIFWLKLIINIVESCFSFCENSIIIKSFFKDYIFDFQLACFLKLSIHVFVIVFIKKKKNIFVPSAIIPALQYS